jgi:hypothetical protein
MDMFITRTRVPLLTRATKALIFKVTEDEHVHVVCGVVVSLLVFQRVPVLLVQKMDRYECLAILQDTLAIPGLVFVGRVGVRAQEVCGVELSRPANECVRGFLALQAA